MEIIEMENNFPPVFASELANSDVQNQFCTPEFLSQAHLDFMVGYLEFERLRDAAIIDNFLLLKERS
jgi:hypothetical protein